MTRRPSRRRWNRRRTRNWRPGRKQRRDPRVYIFVGCELPKKIQESLFIIDEFFTWSFGQPLNTVSAEKRIIRWILRHNNVSLKIMKTPNTVQLNYRLIYSNNVWSTQSDLPCHSYWFRFHYNAAARPEYVPTWQLLTRSHYARGRQPPKYTARGAVFVLRCTPSRTWLDVYAAYNIAAHLRGIRVPLVFAFAHSDVNEGG